MNRTLLRYHVLYNTHDGIFHDEIIPSESFEEVETHMIKIGAIYWEIAEA
jgi:hypothetical protein